MPCIPIPNNDCIPALMQGRQRYSDGGGLYLIRGKTPGHFYWRFDYSRTEGRNTLSLGVFPYRDLDDARALAAEFREMVDEGIDPSAKRSALGRGSPEIRQIEASLRAKRTAKGSFAGAAKRWQAQMKDEWSPGYAEKVEGRIRNHLLPALGAKRLKSIGVPDIKKVCEAIQDTGTVETGKRCLTICRRIFDTAISDGLLTTNPCGPVEAGLKNHTPKHRPAILEPRAFGKLLSDIEDYRGTATVKAALALKPMLMVRGIELRKARREEFDLARGVWRIPAERMKGRLDRKRNGEPHVVPLPRQAIEILKRLLDAPLDPSSTFVFQARGKPGRCMSANTLNRALRIMGYCTKTVMTAHGFRATARTMLVDELGWNKDVAERQLAHTVPDQNGTAYNRTRHLRERRQMLQAWADYLDMLRANWQALPDWIDAAMRDVEGDAREQTEGPLASRHAGQFEFTTNSSSSNLAIVVTAED